MPSFSRPTMRQIAEKADVSVMTVSLALRDHRSIPESTRLRIKTLANELGYRPDPALHAFHSYRRNSRRIPFQGTLAWIDNLANDNPHRMADVFKAYREGATRRAVQLGYKLEIFWLGAPGMSQERMTNILLARNITGLLLPPQAAANVELDVEWKEFSVVTFGYTLARPRFHAVCNHHHQSMLTSLQKLQKLGYRRIGFALSAETNDRVQGCWLAGYMAEWHKWPKPDRIEPLMITGGPPDAKIVGRWLKRWRPDAVVAIDPLVAKAAETAGFSIPDDLGFALFGDSQNSSRFAHIDENSSVIGATAVDMLISMQRRNEQGVPDHPIKMMVEGSWVDAPSAPPRKRNLA